MRKTPARKQIDEKCPFGFEQPNYQNEQLLHYLIFSFESLSQTQNRVLLGNSGICYNPRFDIKLGILEVLILSLPEQTVIPKSSPLANNHQGVIPQKTTINETVLFLIGLASNLETSILL
ncbi:hypothetical protein MTR_5g083375 [Medicago truncatula]|uniref:Uncharacterized protein n=1 Tax=Medicago truncatula TaxID=3880 RepID=A0A072UFU4_MEDTR|nr:hypothetical protein MTR_5g083375 [Medicago truncatula]